MHARRNGHSRGISCSRELKRVITRLTVFRKFLTKTRLLTALLQTGKRVHTNILLTVIEDSRAREPSSGEPIKSMTLSFASHIKSRNNLSDLEIEDAFKSDSVCIPNLKVIHTAVPDDFDYPPIPEQGPQSGQVTSSEARRKTVDDEDVLGERGTDAYEGNAPVGPAEVVSFTVEDEEGSSREY